MYAHTISSSSFDCVQVKCLHLELPIESKAELVNINKQIWC